MRFSVLPSRIPELWPSSRRVAPWSKRPPGADHRGAPAESRPVAEWIAARYGPGSLLLAPLTRLESGTEEKTIGLISIAGSRLGSSEISAVSLFARHISVALENARFARRGRTSPRTSFAALSKPVATWRRRMRTCWRRRFSAPASLPPLFEITRPIWHPARSFRRAAKHRPVYDGALGRRWRGHLPLRRRRERSGIGCRGGSAEFVAGDAGESGRRRRRTCGATQ